MNADPIANTEFARNASGQRRIGLGCMALTGIYGAVAPEDARATLHKALDLGLRLFDTAALYADGANETLVGETLGDRDDVFIVTKFGLVANGSQLIRDSRPESMRQSVDASLKRLRRERIDLLLQHRPDPETSDEDVVSMAGELIRDGKIAAFGLSGTTMERVAQIGAKVHVAAVQNELSIASPENMSDAASANRAAAMFMAHSPLGRGLLTGRAERDPAADDLRSNMSQFRPAVSSLNHSLLKRIDGVAARHSQSRAAIALAWTLHLGANVVPIPGARTPEQIEQCVSSAEVTLTQQEVAFLTGIDERFHVLGPS